MTNATESRRRSSYTYQPKLRDGSSQSVNKNLYEKYGWLQNYEPPTRCATDWELLGSAEIQRFCERELLKMSQSQFYRIIYPVLHECQFGYNPRQDERRSRRLQRMPRWIVDTFIDFCTRTDLLESQMMVEEAVKQQQRQQEAPLSRQEVRKRRVGESKAHAFKEQRGR